MYKILLYLVALTGFEASLVFLHVSALTRTMIKSYCPALADDFDFLAPIIGNACMEHVLLTMLAVALVGLPVVLYFSALRFRVFDEGFSLERPLVSAAVAFGFFALIAVLGMEFISFKGMWQGFGQNANTLVASLTDSSKGPIFTVFATILTVAIAQAAAFGTAMIYHTEIFPRS